MKSCHLQTMAWTIGYYAMWNKSVKDRYHMALLICGFWNAKQQINNLETDS